MSSKAKIISVERAGHAERRGWGACECQKARKFMKGPQNGIWALTKAHSFIEFSAFWQSALAFLSAKTFALWSFKGQKK
jgi:hypothetical protein